MSPLPLFCPNCGDTRNLKKALDKYIKENIYSCKSCGHFIGDRIKDLHSAKVVYSEVVQLDATGNFKPMVARSTKWPALRKRHLKKHPKCWACGGSDYIEVHHIVPVHVDPKYELDPLRLLTLCEAPSHNCHLIFGHFLNWKCWNPRAKDNSSDYYTGLVNRNCK